MPGGASFDTLYDAIGVVLKGATGRSWWRKGAIQARPNTPYATVWLSMGTGQQLPVIEVDQLSTPDSSRNIFSETPWGTSLLECQIDFYRSQINDSVLDACARFANALRLSAREYDLWQICGMSGGTNITDISGIFRADVEPRARVTFHVYANLNVAPLAGVNIPEIKQFPVPLSAENETSNLDFNLNLTNTGENDG